MEKAIVQVSISSVQMIYFCYRSPAYLQPCAVLSSLRSFTGILKLASGPRPPGRRIAPCVAEVEQRMSGATKSRSHLHMTRPNLFAGLTAHQQEVVRKSADERKFLANQI